MKDAIETARNMSHAVREFVRFGKQAEALFQRLSEPEVREFESIRIRPTSSDWAYDADDWLLWSRTQHFDVLRDRSRTRANDKLVIQLQLYDPDRRDERDEPWIIVGLSNVDTEDWDTNMPVYRQVETDEPWLEQHIACDGRVLLDADEDGYLLIFALPVGAIAGLPDIDAKLISPIQKILTLVRSPLAEGADARADLCSIFSKLETAKWRATDGEVLPERSAE